MLQVAPHVGPLVGPRVGINNEWGGFPADLAQLNGTFAPWGVSFAHAYNFSESSGDAVDIATSSPSNLSPANAPTQGVVTGLVGGDKGVTMADNTAQGFAGSATAFDVTTGDLVMLATMKCNTKPAGDRFLFWKQAGGAYWRTFLQASGGLQMQTWDSSTAPTATLAVDHVTGSYVDVLFILDRAAGTDRMAVVSNLGASAIATPSANTLSNSGTQFLIGASAAAGVTLSFFAWGTAPGSLISAGTTTNASNAISAWRRARAA